MVTSWMQNWLKNDMNLQWILVSTVYTPESVQKVFNKDSNQYINRITLELCISLPDIICIDPSLPGQSPPTETFLKYVHP